MTNSDESIFTVTGRGLDAIGAEPGIELQRDGLEADEDYRERLIVKWRERWVSRMVQPDPKAGLLIRIRELGVKEVSEETIAFCHFKLTVDDEYVDAVKQAVYDCVPITYKVDVVGRAASGG